MKREIAIYKLYEVCKEFNELSAKLETSEITEEELKALIDSDEKVQALLTTLITISDEEQGMLSLVDQQIKQLTERKKRLTNINKNTRKTLLNAMRVCNIKRIKMPVASISISKGQNKVVIDDEFDLLTNHPEYFTRAAPKLDKKKLKEELTYGVVVEGAHLEKEETILIRR